MATHKSAIKEHRQALARRDRNRHVRSQLRTAIKKYRQLLEGGDADQAKQILPATLALIDRSAKHGAIHDSAAARTKSRLTKALNRLSVGA